MVDRELEVTGVAAEGFDQEERVTGVPAGNTDGPGIAPPPVTDQGVEAFSEQARNRAGLLMRQSEGPTIGSGVGWTRDDRDRLRAKLWETVPSLMGDDIGTERYLNQLTAITDPELMELAFNDVDAALAQTDEEYVAARMMQIALSDSETSAGRLVEAALMSAVTQHAKREYPLVALGRIRRDQQIMENEFEKGSLPVGDVARATGATGDELERLLQSDELRDVLARDGVWKVDDRRLVVTYEDETGPQSAMVYLDEGTKINTNIQAMAALVQAKNGTAHRLELDEVQGKRAIGGIVGKTLGDTVRFVERNSPIKPVIGGSSDEDVRRDAQEWTERDIETGRAAARVYQDVRSLPEMAGISDEMVYAMAADIAQSDEYADMTAEQMTEMFRQQADERGSAIPFLTETIMPPTVRLLETYDKMVHQIGLTLLGAGDAIQNEFDSDELTTWRSAFDDAYEHEYVSEWFGIDPSSGWGTTLNVGASVLFDPITWVTPGGKASWAWMKEMMTNPEMANLWVRTPMFRSAIRQAVTKNDQRIALSLIVDGMPVDKVARVLEITAATIPKADQPKVAKELADLFVDAIQNSNYIPSNPRSMVHVKNVQGMGALFANMDRLSNANLDRLASLFARVSGERGASVSDDFTQRALEALITRFGNDSGAVLERFRTAVAAEQSTLAGSADEVAALAARVEEAKRELNVVSRARRADPDVATVQSKREFLDELDRIIADYEFEPGRRPLPTVDELDVPGGAGRNLDETIYDLRDRIRMEVDQYGPQFDEADEAAATLKKEIADLERQIDRLENPKNRSALERWWHEFYDEWADELGIPRLEGDENLHPFLRDADGNLKHEHDWSVVTGENNRNWADAGEDVSVYGGYVGPPRGSDKTAAELEQIVDGLRRTGVQPDMTVTVLPASPMEMLAYKHGATSKLAALRPDTAANRTLNMVQNLFASTVLLNLNTPIKTHGDEVIRFINEVGFNSDSVFRINTPASISGDVGSRARANVRNNTPGAGAGRTAQWDWVDPSVKGQWSAAERFVNGGMRNDDVVRRYMQALTTQDRAEWTRWWNREGHQIYGKTIQGRTMTAEEAYQAVDAGVSQFLNRSSRNPEFTSAMRDEVVEAIAQGRPVNPGNVGMKEAEFWRKFPEVPGQLNPEIPKSHVFDRGFDLLYGNPSNRRQGVIYQHHFDKALDMLEARHTNNGRRILRDITPGDEAEFMVREGYAKSKSEALNMLAQGKRNPKVAAMLRQNFVLESDLHNAAAAYAKASADSMMYQTAAVSIGGKAMSRVYPWGRAQIDYIQYWFRKLTEPTQFQLQRPSLSPKSSFQKPVGPMFTPSTATKAGRGELNRVNLRLMDRIAHIMTMGPHESYTVDLPGPAGVKSGAGSDQQTAPKYVLNSWSFLPTSFDENFIWDMSFSPGPIPSWGINWIDEDSPLYPLRQAFETIHPTHAIFSDYTNSQDNWTTNLINEVVPNSPKSLRNVAAQLAGVLGAYDILPGADGIYNWLTGATEPPFYRDQLAIAWGDYLDQHAFDELFTFQSDTPDTPFARVSEQIGNQANRAAHTREALESIRKNLGAESYFGEEVLYAKFALPIDDYLDEWIEAGYVDRGQADSWRITAGIVSDDLAENEGVVGSQDRRDRKDFMNTSTDILFSQIPQEELNRYVAENPGFVVNMVPWVHIPDMEKVPDKWREYVSGGKIQTDDTNLRNEIYRDGYDHGWIQPRDRDDIERDLFMSFYRSVAGYLKSIYEEDTGLSYNGDRAESKMKIRGNIDAETWAPREQTFENLGMAVPDEWRTPDGGVSMTVGEYRDWIRGYRSEYAADFTIPKEMERVLRQTPTGSELLVNLQDAENALRREDFEVSDLAEKWPEGFETIKEQFRREVSVNPTFGEAQYERWFADAWGPLDYTPPEPPSLDKLDFKIEGGRNRFVVVDGDTIDYLAADGEPVRFRLVGINAAEAYEDGGDEATDALVRLLNQADSIAIGAFDQGRFGTTQAFYTTVDDKPLRRERVFGWLYVDGQPVWFPEVFSPDNPRGAPRGESGGVPDYSQWLTTTGGI